MNPLANRPIFSLPLELLQFIFILASSPPPSIREHYRLLCNKPHKEIDVRLAITHVCRRFRLAALASPSLWATITSSMSRSLVDSALQRAKSAPLTIDIRDDLRNVSDMTAWTRLLKRLEGRWTSCRIIDVDEIFWEFWVLNGLKLTGLRTFVTRLQWEASESALPPDMVPILHSLFTHAPNLSSLEIWNARLSGEVEASRHIYVMPSLHTLRFINVASINFGWLAWLLDCAPKLKSLHITPSLPLQYGHIVSELDEPLRSEHLEVLCLQVDNDRLDACFIRQLFCPSLRRLELSSRLSTDTYSGIPYSRPPRNEPDLNEVYNAVVGQNWTLETLDLAHIPCQSQALFSQMTGVTQLALNSFADFRRYFICARESARASPETPSTDFPLRELAIADLEEPERLLLALEADWPNPLSGLRLLYAPKLDFWLQYGAQSEMWVRHRARVVSDTHLRARRVLKMNFPAVDSWPEWATMMTR